MTHQHSRYIALWDWTQKLKTKKKKKIEGGFHFSLIVLQSKGFSVGKYTQIFNFTVSQRSKVIRFYTLKATKDS